MTAYEVNQTLTFGLKVYDANGALADLGGGLPTATLTKPDGTTTAAGVAKASTGNYVATATGGLAGRWRCVWTGTGANSGGLPYTDIADVWPADPRMIISLADARAALNIKGATAPIDDEELRLYVCACTEVVEALVGPVLLRERTEVLEGEGTAVLLLAEYPESITSVKEDGVTLSSSAYTLGRGGVLRRKWGVWVADEVEVVYESGWSSIPPSVILAAREEVRYLWQVGQTGQRPSLGSAAGGAGYVTTMPQGFAVPRRVVELLGDSIAAHKPIGWA